ncbi:MAG: radical SAM protein [Nitrososphaerota archaeon]|nr:radical SAM protein [Nitrososphaerota archaeon]
MESDEKRTTESQARTDCVLLVPPILKYASGPLLGPAILDAVANLAGLAVKVVDANIEFLRSTTLLPEPEVPPPFYGDHAKGLLVLQASEARFWGHVLPAFSTGANELSRIRNGWYSHQELVSAIENLSEAGLGRFLRQALVTRPSPRVFGVSVMWSGQVVAGALASKIARQTWPGVRIVWGGAHITAIAKEVATDRKFSQWMDGALPGHCEQSFVDLLASGNRFGCKGLIIPGCGIPQRSVVPMVPPPAPKFSDLESYGYPILTLPVELSVGCAYAKCTFCTYPATEGAYRSFPLKSLEQVVKLADGKGAAVSLKDSLVTAPLLRTVAAVVRGRVSWSACTKLSWALNSELLNFIAANGCRTLEIGLESLLDETQRRIDKVQSSALLDNFLKSARDARLSVVVNYMTGFPWEDEREATRTLRELERHLASMRGLVYRVEHNTFNLERLSPMATFPAKFGVKVTRAWPWASVLEWSRVPYQLQGDAIPLEGAG